jgi:hypothetical protein
MVSKLNNDRKAGEGAGQAIGRIYGKIGFGGLWNGLPVRIFMIGTLTAFQWLIYDSFKVYLGVSCSHLRVYKYQANLPTAAYHWWSLSFPYHGASTMERCVRCFWSIMRAYLLPNDIQVT